jgi:hypothetical protein
VANPRIPFLPFSVLHRNNNIFATDVKDILRDGLQSSTPPTSLPFSASTSIWSLRNLQVLRLLKASGSAHVNRLANKVYFINYKLKATDLDPRLYARDYSTDEYYSSTCVFDTVTDEGYGIIATPTQSSTSDLIAVAMAKGIVTREVHFTDDPKSSKGKPGLVNGILEHSSTECPIVSQSASRHDHVASLLKKTDALSPKEIEAMQELGKKLDVPCMRYMGREYFKIFDQAMSSDASLQKRLFDFESCNILAQLDMHQQKTGVSDLEMWPLVFSWQSEREEAYDALFKNKTE